MDGRATWLAGENVLDSSVSQGGVLKWIDLDINPATSDKRVSGPLSSSLNPNYPLSKDLSNSPIQGTYFNSTAGIVEVYSIANGTMTRAGNGCMVYPPTLRSQN